jgi:uncharacterized SAM-binding protein YcdF (DUF218 family)
VTPDAIVVPGGGLARDGRVPEWTAARLDLALSLRGAAATPLLVLSAGTAHKPAALDRQGHPITEARAAAAHLAGRGVPSECVFTENCSYDTIGNAYFARTIHTAVRGWRRLLVVTSAFHLERTRMVFEWVFGAAGADGPYELDFAAAADVGLSAAALAARRAKERAAVEALQPLVARLSTLAAIHEWLFRKHALYAAGRRPAPLRDPLLESY